MFTIKDETAYNLNNQIPLFLQEFANYIFIGSAATLKFDKSIKHTATCVHMRKSWEENRKQTTPHHMINRARVQLGDIKKVWENDLERSLDNRAPVQAGTASSWCGAAWCR
jgi:hypothetical protein